MTSPRILLVLVIAVAAALGIGAAVPGAARAADVTEARSVGRFSAVSLDGAFSADVRAGSATCGVSVSGDPALVALVTTEVRDGTLNVGMRNGNGDFHRPAHLTITVPVLRSFANQGASTAHITGLTGGNVALTDAGAASIVATGRAAHLQIRLDGAGHIDAAGVDARDADVQNNGLGLIDVRASGTLSLEVNGVGAIRYAGNPAHIDRTVNGIGSISRL